MEPSAGEPREVWVFVSCGKGVLDTPALYETEAAAYAHLEAYAKESNVPRDEEDKGYLWEESEYDGRVYRLPVEAGYLVR